MLARRELLRLGQAALAWRLLLGANRAAADAFAEELAELEERTKEYRTSLERLVAVHETAAGRATDAAERARRLHAEGLVARRDVDEAARVAAEARARLDDARKQLADSEGLIVEAQALQRLA